MRGKSPSGHRHVTKPLGRHSERPGYFLIRCLVCGEEQWFRRWSQKRPICKKCKAVYESARHSLDRVEAKPKAIIEYEIARRKEIARALELALSGKYTGIEIAKKIIGMRRKK
jgi:hypothetical protein